MTDIHELNLREVRTAYQIFELLDRAHALLVDTGDEINVTATVIEATEAAAVNFAQKLASFDSRPGTLIGDTTIAHLTRDSLLED